MLFKRRETENQPVSVGGRTPVAPIASEADKALDAVTALVRAYGEHAFDTDAFEAADLALECDAWATKIALGARPEPGQTASSETLRDFVGLRRFFNDKRKTEGQYVARSMGNLRQAIQTFAQCLTAALGEERTSDREIETRLVNLSTALTERDTDRIRREAAQVVSTVREAISGRRRREQQQIQVLGDRLRELRSELTEAKSLAATDPLTKLGNRAAFDEHIQRLTDLGVLFTHPPCLMLMDIDHFKKVNDKFGHPGGDSVLREVGNTLARTFLRKQDFLCRYGGEEFAILLVDTDRKSVCNLAQRTLAALRDKSVLHEGQGICVTASIGLSLVAPGESVSSWIKRTDDLLYQAKREGRDRVVTD
jgi:diguanylate cyclase (GGDEF)-like protein